MPDSKKTLRLVLPPIIVAAALVFSMPRTATFGYDYKKGTPWKYETLFAPFDFPIIKTQDQIDEELRTSENTVIPYYRYSDEVVNRNLRTAENLEMGNLRSKAVETLRKLFQKGIVSDEGVRQDAKGSPSDVLYVQKDKRAAKRPVSEVFKLSDARARLFAEVSQACDTTNVDSLLRVSGAYDLVVPNLVYDAQATELLNSENSALISPTIGYVRAGELIVSEGEIVTAEIAQILDSYHREYEANVGYAGPLWLFWLGNSLIAIAIVTILLFIIYYTNKSVFADSRYYYILLVFLLFSLASLLVVRFAEEYIYLVPFTLAALYLQAFARARLIVPVYVVSLLPLLIFSHNGGVQFVMFLTSGVLGIYVFKFLGKGWKQFIAALINFAVLEAVFLAFRFVGLAGGDLLRTTVQLFFGSMFAVAGYPLIYLFEKMFNLVSNSRLEELADTSGKLLRQLELKAPGSFQHSLQVMNMADAAARAVDANPLLLRVGALYHDIGKMNNPQCFVENESLLGKPEEEKYHHNLPPDQSAADIINHVNDGVDIAVHSRLPQVVVDFIRTHHGTTPVKWFLSKYLADGGDPAREPDFHYPGVRPWTKEQIILMLCDSIEAASRTLTEFTPEAYSDFVENIVRDKMEEGQFEDADISIKELGAVKEAIKTYLAQVRHARVTYPSDKKFKQSNKNESRKKRN